MFSRLRLPEIIVQLEQQTHFESLPNQQHRPQQFHGGTPSEILFQLFLSALFAVLVSNGQIMVRDNLYVCDDNGLLHFVDYTFICSLIDSLCNSDNIFDHSCFLDTKTNKFMFLYDQWCSDYFTRFLAKWKQTEYKHTLSTRYFSRVGHISDSTEGFKVPSCYNDTIIVPQYYGRYYLCAFTWNNLTVLEKWDKYKQRDHTRKQWVLHSLVREFIDAYEPDILYCKDYAMMISQFINKRRHNYTMKILKHTTARYVNTLRNLLGFYACSHLENDIAQYVMSFVGTFKFVIHRLDV